MDYKQAIITKIEKNPKNIITVQEFMLLSFLIFFNCLKSIKPKSIISACNVSYRLKRNSISIQL